MKVDEDKLLVRIAEMYYLEEKNQSQISKELAIHRTTISRLLKKSREEGIVEIGINYDLAGTYSLEKRLEEQFSLERAIVVPASEEMRREQKDRLLGEATGEYLANVIADKMTIGFSWGQTLAAVVEKLPFIETEGVVCVPVIGGPSGRMASDYHVNTLTYEAAKKMRGKALMIDSPAIPETVALKKALVDSAYNKQLATMWKILDLVIFGIGSPHLSKRETWRQFYGEDVLDGLEKKQVCGDVVSRFYDNDGRPISSDLDQRIIGITLDDLKNIPIRVGVAESKDKANGILGALKGGYVTTFVTTEETAQEMIRIEENEEKLNNN